MAGIVSYGLLGGIGAGEAIKKKRTKDKISVVVGIMMPSQAAPYLARGEIYKGFFMESSGCW